MRSVSSRSWKAAMALPMELQWLVPTSADLVGHADLVEGSRHFDDDGCGRRRGRPC